MDSMYLCFLLPLFGDIFQSYAMSSSTGCNFFCISYRLGLTDILSMCLSVPFLIISKVPTITNMVVVLRYHIFSLSIFYHLLISTFKKKGILLGVYTLLKQYLHTDQVLLSNSSDSFQNSLLFSFSYQSYETIQFNLNFFYAIAIFDLIRQFVLKTEFYAIYSVGL